MSIIDELKTLKCSEFEHKMKQRVVDLIDILSTVLSKLQGKFTFTKRHSRYIESESLCVLYHISKHMNDVNLYDLVPQLTVCEELILQFKQLVLGKIDFQTLNCRFTLESVVEQDFLIKNELVPIYKIAESNGRVYKCYDQKQSSFVAVKIVDSSSYQYQHEIEYYQKKSQVRCLKKESDSQDFAIFVIPFVNGSTLANIVEIETEEQRFKLIIPKFRSIARNVETIMLKGLIHRDLSLPNFISSFSLCLKTSPISPYCFDIIEFNDRYNIILQFHLIDFGCTRKLEKQMTAPVGNPATMAPELRDAKEEYHNYDQKVDMFSLGCILFYYICKTEISEFVWKNRTERYYSHCITSQLEKKIKWENENIQKMIVRMLRHDPNDRPSIEEVLKHLEINTAITVKPPTKRE